MAATAPYWVGAVVYHPKVEQIWPSFGEWFAEQGFLFGVRYAGSYDEQIGALLGGQLDTAWNTDLAHVQVLAGEPDAGALAMRDTDRGWRSHLEVLADTAAASLAELEGARVGFDDADSPQAHILPVHALREQGAGRPRRASRSTTPSFQHRCFTRPPGPRAEAHARPNELLFAMDAADPKLCEPLELQYVNQWVGFDPDGYRQLVAAVAAGLVVVG